MGRGGEAEPPAAAGDPVRVAQVEAVIETVRPVLAADGGDVHLVEVDDEGWVRLRMVGACEHCYQSPVTVQGVLEPRLRAELDWVRGVRVA